MYGYKWDWYIVINIWLNEINMKYNGIKIMVLIGIYYELVVGLLI